MNADGPMNCNHATEMKAKTTTPKSNATNPTEMTGLELLRTMSALPRDQVPSIGRLLGMTVTELEEGRVSIAVDTQPDFANPLGTVHGGICAALLDSVMGTAVHTTLGPGVGYSTLELKVNYIRSVATDGRSLIATGTTQFTWAGKPRQRRAESSTSGENWSRTAPRHASSSGCADLFR